MLIRLLNCGTALRVESWRGVACRVVAIASSTVMDVLRETNKQNKTKNPVRHLKVSRRRGRYFLKSKERETRLCLIHIFFYFYYVAASVVPDWHDSGVIANA